MTKGKIGVQMMMLKEKVEENGPYETLKRLHELGYGAVEVSQIPMTKENVSELKRASNDFGIKIAALSAGLEPILPGAPGETLTEDFDKIVEDCKTLDCQFVRIGMMPLKMMSDKDSIMSFIECAEEMAGKLEEHGIHLYYHTHHIEFQKFDGEYLLDLMKDNTDKIGFELDVHWIQRAGVNPVKFIKEYKGRISLLHLKDYRVGALETEPEDFEDMAKFFHKFTNIIEFAEVGEGNLDMPAIIEAGLESGAEYFLIEQDDTYGRDPFDSLEISAGNLRELGYGDWF
ncbi:sugar phosphate isomerase/epimerase family protein [Salinicoccus roseus]|uniref:Sugar phosphate isomerase n=1 Tax=Salinicoccus roseus TaxID=45670 RepID=A0A0C2HGR1_9STAP|nr:sugar phosphate isomerase/epimerase [Salinicoccus roseus]KIH70809.1 sugar phosphate isomerase [Salinicoccus roseus]MDB0580453.1 sugar phosphate isomerase/epimerase [Salinicoccus roseus]